MKNLPDNELFNEIGKRLKNYAEDPDEDAWNKILTATQNAQEPKWISRMLYASAAASIAAFLLLLYPASRGEKRLEMGTVTNQKAIEKKSAERNVSSITDELNKVVSEDKAHSRKTNKVELPGTLIQNYHEVGKSLKNELEGQYNIENSINGEFREELQTVNKPFSESRVNSDSLKEPVIARTDSVKAEGKKSIQEKKKRIRRVFDFYASVTPLLSYQKVTPLQNDNITVDRFSASPVLSGDRFGLSVEIGVQGKLSKYFEYYGGLSYYQQNQTLSYHYKSGEGTTVESGSDPLHFTITPGEHDGQVNYNMKNVGTQLGILYYLKGDALTHKVGAGLSYQQGLQKISEGETYDNSKSSYLFYQLFYRAEFRVNESTRIFFQPNFSQAFFSNENLNEPFKLKPYRAGLGFGLLYRF